jgi:glycosyltransferase involved in cell wall biosynthesis
MIVNPASDGTTIKVACVVLTFNEEIFIEDCLRHVKPYVDWLLVSDGGSTDATWEIARRIANQVIIRPFSGSFATERNVAQDRLPSQIMWILMVDADERFNIQFLKGMRQIIGQNNVDCFRFPRINKDKRYMNKLINKQDHQVRLYKRLECCWVRPVHEILWHKTADKRADQHSVLELSQYPILHLKRSKDERKAILARWKTLEKQQTPTS